MKLSDVAERFGYAEPAPFIMHSSAGRTFRPIVEPAIMKSRVKPADREWVLTRQYPPSFQAVGASYASQFWYCYRHGSAIGGARRRLCERRRFHGRRQRPHRVSGRQLFTHTRGPGEGCLQFWCAFHKKSQDYESDAAKASNEEKRGKALDKAHKYYSEALPKFVDAVSQQPAMYQAWNYIGFANRHLGNYDAALSAYAKALDLNPAYLDAVEYRAEAYLA